MQRLPGLFIPAVQPGRSPAAGGEQDGGFAGDDFQVLGFSRIGVAGPGQLQYLALGDGIGGVGHVLQDIHIIQLYHELEGAGIQEITHQH